jgi:hypothetical protein
LATSWWHVYLKCNKRAEIKYCHNYRKWDIVQDIIEDFIAKLQLKPSLLLIYDFISKKSMAKMNDYSAYKAAKEITIPVLVIHDKDDLEVPVKAAQHIYDHLKMVNSINRRFRTPKILGDSEVIQRTVQFVSAN